EPIAFGVGALAGLGAAWAASAGRASRGATAPALPKNEDQHARMAATIADENPDAVLFFADSGQIRFANAMARELFFEGREPQGQNFLRLVASAPLPLREALLGESDRLFNIEVEGQRETFHVSRRSFVVADELHTLLIVKHLTREISRQEVEVLKRVIRVISHEVNNSLAPVSSLVHSARKIAQGPEPSAKLGRVFDTIEERARHLATFLEGYANMARLPEPRPRRIDWEPFLRHLAELHPELALPPPPAEVGIFDPVQIEQVLINLFKNAIEAGSPSDGIELSVRVGPSGETELRMRDRGPGFSDEALKSALLPLYTTKERGSGMGLALCREIVEAHGGTIGLANAPDGGAVVNVRLPGRKREDAALQLSRSRLTLTRG
ncbi:MAG TPA: ATP-binding protein, partial [Polyangiaceae bacterium]